MQKRKTEELFKYGHAHIYTIDNKNENVNKGKFLMVVAKIYIL
jgi:hypothetical protein